MEHRVTQGARGAEVFVSGKLTMRDHDEFQALLGQIADKTGERVVFDLSGLEFIDSAGLGLLLVAREQARTAGKQMVLRKPRPHVLQLLELGDFRRVMAIEP